MAEKKIFEGKVVFITGGTRGIGEAIALKLASKGAKIALAAKTDKPHPKLPGTLSEIVSKIEALGSQAIGIKTDIRSEEEVEHAIEETVKNFGGIDMLINNASAISLTGTLETPMKRFDLMVGVNGRGTFMVSQKALPHLLKAKNPHILNLSPPLNMKPKWFQNHTAYTMAKYMMSMCVLGMSEEFKGRGVAVNALWPQTAIYTAATAMLGLQKKNCRKPAIMADAAFEILKEESKKCTGNFFIDEQLLREKGVDDFSIYANDPDAELFQDFFID